MGLLNWLKGVFKRMIAPDDIAKIFNINPAVSSTMRNKIEEWESMYKGEAPWIHDNVKSLGLPAMIASEKARMATLEMQIKITGDNERADFIKTQFEKKFLPKIRENLEYGIALGGFIVKPYVTLGAGGYVLEFSFVNAEHFYPLAFSPSGRIIEAAFVDRILTKDTIYSKVEHHKLIDNNKVQVSNFAYKKSSDLAGTYNYTDTELGTPIPLSEVPEWASLEPVVVINDLDTLLFAYFKMPQANHIDLESPLGVSGFSRAEQLIQDADEQYSNLLWEFEGGQLAVDVDRTAFNVLKDKNGQDVYSLPKMQDRLFRRNMDLGSGDDGSFYQVFSPALRDSSILNGLNSILMHIEDVTDLSRGTISMVSYTEARTATELKILKQRSYAANRDIQKELERVMVKTFEIMDKYCDLYKIVPSGKFEVAYAWDDSIIVDKDQERQVDLLDVQGGLMSKVEYRMKWFGETEDQATEAVNKIFEQQKKDMELQMIGKTPEEQTTLERANESKKVTPNI